MAGPRAELTRARHRRLHRPLLRVAIVVALLVAGAVMAAIALQATPGPTPEERADQLCGDYRQRLNVGLVAIATGPGSTRERDDAAFALFVEETGQLADDLDAVDPPPAGVERYVVALRAAHQRVRDSGSAAMGEAGQADPFGPALDAALAAGLEGCA